ncbi:hypothetical protein CDA63_16900 [Hymenobacter amundsenii]|uniref:Outer membrane protein beta-barrel domain-containing protein n=1 Tax=Hymenobacter amundsenii TaxID=2006685 RepID=A0A246FHB0_9BACT|nr:hypothetical protein [Hymenobacter amundsenii]OWP61923.1 hypothetical protein CDA63_16900 [Hymenobacter amundsenii]
MLKTPFFPLGLAVLLGWHVPSATAQQIKYGVSAGLVRSFVYPQGFSTKPQYDYVRAEGQWGYQVGAHAEHALGPKTAVDAGLRFLSTATRYDLFAVVPTAFQVTYMWRAARQHYRFSTGLTQVLAARGTKELRVFGGLATGLEVQQLQYEGTAFSMYNLQANDLSVTFDYQEPERAWVAGLEAGAGLRLYHGVDLNLRYTYNFTPTAPIAYTSAIAYTGAAGSPRNTTGVVRGRPTFAAAELVIWFN